MVLKVVEVVVRTYFYVLAFDVGTPILTLLAIATSMLIEFGEMTPKNGPCRGDSQNTKAAWGETQASVSRQALVTRWMGRVHRDIWSCVDVSTSQWQRKKPAKH